MSHESSLEKVESLYVTIKSIYEDIKQDNECYLYQFLGIFEATNKRFWEFVFGIGLTVTTIIAQYVWSSLTGKESPFG